MTFPQRTNEQENLAVFCLGVISLTRWNEGRVGQV